MRRWRGFIPTLISALGSRLEARSEHAVGSRFARPGDRKRRAGEALGTDRTPEGQRVGLQPKAYSLERSSRQPTAYSPEPRGVLGYAKRGQSTLEYAVLIAAVTAAVVVMSTYVRRAVNANFKLLEESVNESVPE